MHSGRRGYSWGLAVLALCLVVGSLVRGYFLSRPGFDSDLNWQLNWGKRVYHEGFWELYRGDFTNRNRPRTVDIVDYPPAVPLLAAAAVNAYPRKFQERKQWYRRAGTIAELAVVAALIVLILRHGGSFRWFAACLAALNPGLIFATSAWGQVDSVLAVALVLSFFGASSQRFKWLGAVILLAPLIKPQGALFVVVYLAMLAGKREWRLLAWHVLAGSFVLGAAILSFRVFAGSNFMDIYTKAVGAFPSLSWTAANTWWAVFGGKAQTLSDQAAFLGVSYRLWGLAGFAAASFLGWVLYAKSPQRPPDVWLFATWVSLAFFLFPTQMHERYLYYAVLLSLVPAAFSPVLLALSALLSALLYLNASKVFASYHPSHLPEWITQGGDDLHLTRLSWWCVGAGLCYFVAATRYFRRKWPNVRHGENEPMPGSLPPPDTANVY